MKTAVIKTGGKQYLVQEGDTIKIEKIAASTKDKVNFDNVLLTATANNINIGTPQVNDAQVEAMIIQQGRHRKITGVKMKPKKRYRRLFGHRQHFTEVKITKITAAAAKKAAS